MELWANAAWTTGRSRTAVPPAGTPVPRTWAPRGAGLTPMTVRRSRSVHGRMAAPPSTRRAAGDVVHVVVFIRCPLLSVVVPAKAAGNAGVQLVCAGTL